MPNTGWRANRQPTPVIIVGEGADGSGGPADHVYSATFNAVAVTAAQDIFEIVAATATFLNIREIRLGQYSDPGDAQAELLSLCLIKGYTVAGSGGSTVTPSDLRGSAVAASVVKANNTTVANTGTALNLICDTFNVVSGWWYRPPADERIKLLAGERLVLRVTAPADSLTMNASLVFEETAAT